MADPATGQVGTDFDPKVSFWKEEIETYDREFDKFLRRGRKIQKKYKDVRTEREESLTRYNILWANTQTRLPALYARNPKVQVERRFKDADPVGRVASDILERSIQYTLDHCNDAWQVNRQCVLDYDLPGRGTCWVRYVPHFKSPTTPAAQALDEGSPTPAAPRLQDAATSGAVDAQGQPASTGPELTTVAADPVGDKVLHYEETKLDYVYWEDYGHSWARFDAEVRGKWRRVYLTRKELRDRFGPKSGCDEPLSDVEIDSIPLDWSPKGRHDNKVKMPKGGKKAIVYEIWDQQEREAIWLVVNYPKVLDVRPDPLGLEGFFPTPRPLYANLANDDLVPTPNFALYQDQANEVDELSGRIASITKALKVAGVRDASAEGLDRLLSEGVENALVPIAGWAATKEKGGLAGTFELLPMDTIAETLGALREQRQAVIEDIYQITGISDIVRGMSDPEETATAQQIKSNFSVLRISDQQMEVQRFCRDQVRIIGQLVAGYNIETLKQISGLKLLTGVEKQQIQQQMAMQAMQAAQPPGPPPGPVQSAPGVGTPAGAAVPQGTGSAATGSPPPPTPPQPASPAQPAPPPTAAQAGAGPAGGMHPSMPSQPQTPMPGQAPLSPDKMKLMELPTWEEVEALLKNPVMREFRLDIETDSTIRMDEEAEKSSRMELIQTVSAYVKELAQVGMQAPEILPMMGELLMFGVRAFKTARGVEQTFEDMMDALVKMSKAPKPPPPDIAKIQAQGQVDAMLADKKGQVDMQVAQGEQQAQGQQAAAQLQEETKRDAMKAQLQAETAKQVEAIKTQSAATLQDLTNHFEAELEQFKAEAAKQLEDVKGQWALKIEQEKQKGEAQKQEHERHMQKQQQGHEKSITDKTLKAQGEQAEMKAKQKDAA